MFWNGILFARGVLGTPSYSNLSQGGYLEYKTDVEQLAKVVDKGMWIRLKKDMKTQPLENLCVKV
ncbi:MAG: hypothetical protein QCI82_05045 [Candidatus Thermoplasmatota archaeon]|nr:hypothetical protein [Candidatus Thermoplasmatota archaeon]